MNRFNQETKSDWEEETPADAELRTMWMLEIQPCLDAEMDFLREYGWKAGYDETAMSRIAQYHRQLELLVWKRGGGHIQEFAEVMGEYFRFKENFFISWSKECGHLESQKYGSHIA